MNKGLLIKGAVPPTHPHFAYVGAIEREIARMMAGESAMSDDVLSAARTLLGAKAKVAAEAKAKGESPSRAKAKARH